MPRSVCLTAESAVRNTVKVWAKENGVRHIRMAFMPGVRVGVPDDLFLVPAPRGLGLPVFIEFKREKKAPTPLQYKRLADLQNAGFFAEWFSNANEAIGFLTRCVGAVALHAKGGRAPDLSLCRRIAPSAWGAQDVDNP